MTTRPSISESLRQFALAQVDHAIHYLTAAKVNPDTAIHETRRCVKRVRALLRLLETQFPTTQYDRENLYLRNIGRQLTKLRDAAVRAETLASLQKDFPAALSRDAWRELKKEMGSPPRSLLQQKKKRMTTVAMRLRTARARVENWQMEFDAEAVLRKGLRRTYRRSRRALKQVQESPTAENFHEWRKQVNHLRHQLQILQTLKFGKVKTALRDCKQLTELLGLKNDLAVLRQQLHRNKRNARKPGSQTLQTLIETRDTAYATQSLKLGQPFDKRKARTFLRSIGL